MWVSLTWRGSDLSRVSISIDGSYEYQGDGCDSETACYGDGRDM